MNVIETKELCYSYDGEESALDKVSVKIPKGKITAIMGGNGAGKSTFFLNLNGVLTPDAGQIIFNGKVIIHNKKNIKELRKSVGIVFQDPNDQLFSSSVRKDISFGAVNLGLSEDEISRRVDGAIERVGIKDLERRPIHALSYGQKKRVAIAGVLVMEPEVIILDEPTAGLDPIGVNELMKILIEIKETMGISIIIATHDMDIVPLYCDYGFVFHKGKVIMEGTPKDIFSNPEILRENSLRLPRIAHLMEILKDKDNLNIDNNASTISMARASIKKMVKYIEEKNI
ncbi:ATP-binding cassette domain-containing protein [Clostridium cadaveris]|uniref:ATP-binding cassette domain-containing protein n=1 Tax=Clostridium cadaveris TaxID=1529 RepID=UPI0014592434|nr:ATP-binding cassette domain-containing protein [Clostridium cadaveris]NME66208.1 ATP-binding cassette domain-containing protein [Clostridium cadaveris]